MLVIMGVLGMIEKRTDKHINKLPGSPSQYEKQNITFYGTAHLLRKVLSI